MQKRRHLLDKVVDRHVALEIVLAALQERALQQATRAHQTQDLLERQVRREQSLSERRGGGRNC